MPTVRFSPIANHQRERGVCAVHFLLQETTLDHYCPLRVFFERRTGTVDIFDGEIKVSH